MLFNSLPFLFFMFVVFVVYWFVLNKSVQMQNIFILLASYIFYAWWDWRFLFLIFISSLSDYFIGLQIDKPISQKKQTHWLILSIVINLSILVFFKYFNFFIDNFIRVFSLFGVELNAVTLSIVLPVGISFYTFQTMSYTIDIYRKQLKATKDFISFFAFVSFFPQLVAGPIERASNLLIQFKTKREFDYQKSTIALRQILWGLFQKIVIADNCGVYVNYVFDNYQHQSSITLIFTAFVFAFQIYADFAGYSNIAIGVAQLLGFKLMQNFQSPYFSQNITELWRRWHISLSTWLRDYLYTPLALKTRHWKNWGIAFATILTFLLCGLWHGAAWHFIAFGVLHGVALTYEIFTKKTRKKWKKHINKYVYKNMSIFFTFMFWVFTVIVFRINSLTDFFGYIKQILHNTNAVSPLPDVKKTILWLLAFFIIAEYIGRKNKFAIEKLNKKTSKITRYALYSFLIFLIFMFYQTEGDAFIYFQF